ncbi:hypothetical protein O59_004183 [Cellvibrio sp. BR]|nr:hypothetical protein O59_004183 [Cellvibrio sp. BR]
MGVRPWLGDITLAVAVRPYRRWLRASAIFHSAVQREFSLLHRVGSYVVLCVGECGYVLSLHVIKQ